MITHDELEYQIDKYRDEAHREADAAADAWEESTGFDGTRYREAAHRLADEAADEFKAQVVAG